ncbi:HNH endonuclease [Vibrio splendidus]
MQQADSFIVGGSKVEEKFQRTIIELCATTARETEYNPKGFKSKALRIGALNYAQEILDSANDQWEGFTQLFLNRRLDLSLEVLVLQEQWQKLFTTEQLKTAQRRLLRVEYENIPNIIVEVVNDSVKPKRREYTTNSIVRNPKLAKDVKELYGYKCQMCGVVLTARDIKYAEAAHIRPVGEPHNGDDDLGNILCLCPNHHKLFDLGGVFISKDFKIIPFGSELFIHPSHKIDESNFKYHRDWFEIVA